MNRRVFLRSATAGTGLVLLGDPRSVSAAPANEKVHVALIGVGGRGKEFVGSMPHLANVVALCDVDDQRMGLAAQQIPQAKRFRDFRRMFEEMGSAIDAVVVATPDHTHAVASAAAIRAGKHVYTEKPLTRTVGEARALRELAGKHRVATSMGNQGTASPQFRRALELIRSGALGTITDVHIWNDQGGSDRQKPPEGEVAVPAHLQWDLWLGPTAARPFNPGWLPWHQWRDFGTGNLGNWSSHTTNLPFMALEVDSLWRAETPASPIRIRAKVKAINRLSFPRWERVEWEIPARSKLPAIRFTWHNGASAPGLRDELETLLGRDLDWGDKGAKKWADWAGCLIVGTEGKLLATAHNATFVLLPEAKFASVQQKGPEKVDASQGHEADWLAACRGGKPAWARYEYAGPLTEFNMLGNVATQFEGTLEYDPGSGRILNHAEADRSLRPQYRDGWSL
jgi:hypothetical protein